MRGVCSLLVLGASAAFSAIPQFTDNGLIAANGSPIDAMLPTMCVTDWDGDGLKDLLVGAFTGYLQFFRNSGTNAAPIFTTSVHVQAAGSDIYLPGG